jgi:hypothetical protein
MNTNLRSFLVGGLAILCLWLASSASALNLDSLFTVSVGGAAARDTLIAMRSFHASGTVDFNGQPGKFTELFVPPVRLYLELKFEQFSLVQAYDGMIAWQKDQNGQVTELDGFERRELLKTLYFESYSFMMPGRAEGSCKYRGEVVRNGVTFIEVAFFPLNTDTVIVQFDKTNGLRKYMAGRMDNLMTFNSMEQYTRVSGVLVPMYSESTAPDVPLTVKFITTSARFNEPVDTTMFTKPVQTETGFHFPEGETSVKIAFEYRFGHIYVPVTINGVRRVWLILDTGSSATIFHQPVVADLDLQSAGTVPAKGLGGFKDLELIKTDSVNIGSLTLYGQIGGMMDLAGIGQPGTDGAPFGGVLGYDFLSRFPILIDYRAQTLTVFNPDEFVAPGGGTEVPFHLVMQVPTVVCRLAGMPGEYIIDLGNAYAVIVHKPFAESAQLEKNLIDVHETASMKGVGAGVGGKSGFASKFYIGPVEVDSVRVMLPESSSGISGSEELAGNVGNLTLERFKLLLDYHTQRIIFYPNDIPIQR